MAAQSGGRSDLDLEGISTQEWAAFIAKVKERDVTTQRAVASVFGALVADAAGQPMHWIYNVSQLKSVTSGVDVPEFLSPSANPFYRVETGCQSPYGDALVVQLQSLVECKGFDAAHTTKTFIEGYGPSSSVVGNSGESSKYTKEMQKSKPAQLPISGPWVNRAVREFVDAAVKGLKETANDSIDPDSMARMVPLVALYAGKANMLEVAEDCITLMQDCDIAVASTLLVCRILEMIILANDTSITMETILEGVVKELQDQGRAHPHPLDLAIAGHVKDVLKTDQSLSPLQGSQLFGMA